MYLGQAAFGWLWYLMGMLYATRGAKTIFASPKNLMVALPLVIACILYVVFFHHFLAEFQIIDSKIFFFHVLKSVSIVYIIITMSRLLTEFFDSKNITKYIPSSLAWLGSFSYAVYLTHMFFIPILTLPVPWLLRITAYFSTVLLVSYVLTHTENRLKWFLEK
jgi:peptidoglycan/LPS O-acetylase OafA/YrhL